MAGCSTLQDASNKAPIYAYLLVVVCTYIFFSDVFSCVRFGWRAGLRLSGRPVRAEDGADGHTGGLLGLLGHRGHGQGHVGHADREVRMDSISL